MNNSKRGGIRYFMLSIYFLSFQILEFYRRKLYQCLFYLEMYIKQLWSHHQRESQFPQFSPFSPFSQFLLSRGKMLDSRFYCFIKVQLVFNEFRFWKTAGVQTTMRSKRMSEPSLFAAIFSGCCSTVCMNASTLFPFLPLFSSPFLSSLLFLLLVDVSYCFSSVSP